MWLILLPQLHCLFRMGRTSTLSCDFFPCKRKCVLTWSAVGLSSGFFLRQASTSEQNSGENSCLDSEGDGSSRICHHNIGKNKDEMWWWNSSLCVIHLGCIWIEKKPNSQHAISGWMIFKFTESYMLFSWSDLFPYWAKKMTNHLLFYPYMHFHNNGENYHHVFW